MSPPSPGPVLRFASYELNLEVGELRRHGYRIKLQEKPFQILVALLERPGGLVTREELHQRLWQDNTFVDFDHNLNNAINKLRDALNDSAEKPRFIETVPRRGYRFTAEVAHKADDLRRSIWPNPVQGIRHAGEPPNSLDVSESPQSTLSLPHLTAPSGLEARPRAGELYPKRWRALAAAVASVLSLIFVLIVFSLPSKPVLSSSDLVLISDALNSTGDAVFDDSLKQAISVDLTQSPYLNVLAETRINALLELMTKPANSKLTPAVSRDLCQRAGAKAYITVSIADLGGKYVIGLNAINCQTGESLAREQAAAANKGQILNALDRAAARFRKKLGESLASVQRFGFPLEQATTSSLEALKSYSLGNNTRSDAEAIPLFKRALELDANFALAYDGLGISYSNINEPGLAAENVAKAYQLRDHASERERFRITADYHQVVTGELEKANQTCELWAQIYPRDHYPRNLLGVNYEFLGKYEKAVAETLEAIRLNPDSSFLYSNLMEDYAALGRIEEAKAAYGQAFALKRDQVFLHADRYGIAFLEGDTAEMARQVSWSIGRPGAEDWLLSNESDTNASSGYLNKAREFSQRAADSALHSNETEVAALWQMNAALREAEFGNITRARKESIAALRIASTRDVRILAALAFARSRDIATAEKMASDLANQFPLNTVINSYWLPTIRASIELNRGHGAVAVDILRNATNYEWGGPNPEIEAGRFLYPIYVRGQSYLRLHKGSDAEFEFKKMLDHRGIIQNCPLGTLAHLGLARAFALQGETAKAITQYQEFLNTWKNADSDIPILRDAKAEYAKIHQSAVAQ